MSEFQDVFQKQMKLRAARQEIDDQLYSRAGTFLAAFPGIQRSFEACVTGIAVAMELGYRQEGLEAMNVVGMHLKKAEETWQSEIMQELKIEAHRDISRVLKNPKELRLDVVDLDASQREEANRAINQMRTCVHCLDAVQAALNKLIGDEQRQHAYEMYSSAWYSVDG